MLNMILISKSRNTVAEKPIRWQTISMENNAIALSRESRRITTILVKYNV